MALDSYENRALHRVRESGFPVCDWLRNMTAPPSGGQESNPCPLPHLPHHPGRRAEGLFPQLSWPALQGTPTGSHSSGFQWLLPNSAPGVKGMLSNLWNFFFCRETSTFEFQIPFRPPEQAHCLQESAKPQSSSASLESTGGLFPVYILFLLAGL